MTAYNRADITDFVMAPVEMVDSPRWDALTGNDQLQQRVAQVWARGPHNEENLSSEECYADAAATDWLVHASDEEKTAFLATFTPCDVGEHNFQVESDSNPIPACTICDYRDA